MENTSEFIHNNQYSLSIRLHSDGFSFYIYDETGQLLTKKSVNIPLFSMTEEAILKTFSAETEVKLVFEKTDVICETDNYSLIPNAFFNIETAVDFLHFEKDADANEKVLFNNLPEWEQTLAYSIPQHLFNALNKLFEKPTITSHLSGFLISISSEKEQSGFYTWRRQKMLDIVVVDKRKLIILNSFSYLTAEDFVFYILNVFEQLSLHDKSYPINIFNLGKNNDITALLEKYLDTIHVIS